MNYGQTLIDKAGEICGSFYKLSKRTGFAQATISEIRKGKRDLPMEWVPVLAEISQVDAREALALVLAEKLPEGSEARQILEKARAAGGGEMLPFTYSGDIRGAVAEIAKRLNMLYIVCSRKLRAMLDRPLTWGRPPYPRLVARVFAIRSPGLLNTVCLQKLGLRPHRSNHAPILFGCD